MRITRTIPFFAFLLLMNGPLFPQSVTIIHAGKLLAIPGEGTGPKKTIIVQDGLIAGVKDGFQSPKDLDYDEDSVLVIDLSDRFVLPSLIDMHTHITMERDPKRNPHTWLTLDDEDYAYEAIPYSEATLAAGFTTVRNLGSGYTNINAIKRAIQKGMIVGPRIIAAIGAITATGGHGDFHGYRSEIYSTVENHIAKCDGSDDCRRQVREMVARGADVIKVTATGGVLSNTASGVGQQLTDEELRSIVETAHTLGRKVAAHAHEADGINAALRAGVNSIEHSSYLTEESVRLFKETDAYLVPTLLAGVHMGEEAKINTQIPAFVAEKINQVQPVVEESFKRALHGNVKIAFGTDSGVSKHGMNAREFELMVRYGMGPKAAIRSATVNAADLLDMSDKIGTIEHRKIADIIAVDGDPLHEISRLRDVHFVMKDGVVFKE